MKNSLLTLLSAVIVLSIPQLMYGQAPPLGAASSFGLFTAAGAFSNTGTTVVNGDVGTNVGAFTGFPPGIYTGQLHVADATSAQAATDVDLAYGSLSTVTCGLVLGTTLGNGQILTSNVYCLGGASVLNGDLILDGQCDPNALFIIKVNGALSTNVGSRVILINSASICNVYWQINGAVELGEGSVFRGTIVANGAISLLEGATLLGRGLTRQGAIDLHTNVVSIDLQPTASVITAGSATTFCAGGSVTLSGNCGGVWSTGATTPTITVTTSGSYSVTNSNGCGSAISNTITVTVNPLPICTITGNPAICAGQSTQLCAPAGIGTYLWSTGATTNCITVNAAGTYAVTVTSAAGCSSICSQVVTANPAPVCTITGNPSICAGQSTQLCTPAGAGTYLWSTGATTNCITVNAAGTYAVTVTNASGCSSICSQAVTVNPLPICTITGSPSICAGQSTQLCAPMGAAAYLWSTGGTTNCITVNAAGTYAVTVTNSSGCSSICSQIVTANPLPICTITGNPSICLGQSTQLCTPAGASTYLWSTGGMSNCITVNAAGTYAVTVTNSSGCSSICSQIVTVNPVPICTITGNPSICAGQSTQLCTPAGASSYLWSTGATTNCITVNAAGTYAVTVTNSSGCSSICSQIVTANPLPICTITGNPSICAGQSTQLCTPAGAGTYLWSTGATTNCITVNAAGTYAVTVTSASGCSSICSQAVTVNPLPICTITGNPSICAGQSTQLCTPAGAGTYLWSTGATTNCITVNAAGTYAVTVTSASGCSSICSQIVTVNPLPICTITGNPSICTGQSTQLCTPAGAGTYLWSTGATTNCITVNAAGTYAVTVTSASGCSSICSQAVTVNPLPICTITGNPSICAGQSTQLCTPAGAGTYLWSTGATTNCITVNAAGTYAVTVTSASGCSSICSQAVTVNPLPICTITGNPSICAGQSTQLCTPAGAGTYLWSTGATTNCITVNAAGTYAVTVTSASGCSSICSQAVIENPLPICTITGNPSICSGQSTQLCTPAGAGTYLWSTGATTNCITVNAAGTYVVTVTSVSGCSSICSQTVVVNPLPICTITGNLSICAGQSTQLCVLAGAGTYLWSTGATTNCITVNAAGNYAVTVTNASGCSSICSQTVIASPLPICTITGNLSICQGQSTQLCVAGAGTYLWSTGATTNCITVNAAGNYAVTVTNASGCSSICSQTVIVNPLPICTITGNLSICQGQSTQLCVTGAGTYIWSTGATTNCITVNAAGNYSVTVTNTNGCSSICSQTVIVNPLPICLITGNLSICAAGQPTQLCVAAGAGTYLWSTGATTNCITVNAAGTYAVTVTNVSGCSSICSETVTVNPQPICTITGDNFICAAGQTTQLCVPPGATAYLWSTGATTNCITVNAAGNYAVTVTNAGGCSSICSQIVTVNPLPICTITGNLSICLGQSTQLCVAGVGTYLWSTGATTNCITVNAAGNYAVTVTNAGGCSSVCSQTVIVNPLPICTITGNLSICLGQSTQLCVTGVGSYLWSTGATTNCITVNAAGNYAVTVTNASGCSSVCSQMVTVGVLPVCTITGNLSICQGQSTQLCVPAGTGTYLWSTGATTNCITVNAAGIYAVTLTNTSGCSSICSETVTVNPLPICTITGGNSICLGQSTQLCVPAGAGTYLWSTGATTNCITVNAAGTYAVTVTNAVGCSSICSQVVTVNPLPICTITGNLSICLGQSTQLCVAGVGSYLWSTGATTNCITVNAAGTYAVTVTNASGCSSICSQIVMVNPLPICAITGGNSICLGQSTQLCVPAGAGTYLWNTGATSNCITVNAAGNYSVTVTNASGCSSICSQIVTVNPLPICTITGNTSICVAGQPTQLCVAAGAGTYLWSTGATTNCITVNAAGTYAVTVTNTSGCSSICSQIVTVNPLPICTITGGNSLCLGQSTQLCVPAGAGSYLWSTGTTTNCITVNAAGTYSVTVTNAGGCSSICSQIVTVSPLPICTITGGNLICQGQSTQLCVAAGAGTYLWSTGATTNCITVNVAGAYAVTVTNASGCSSVCSQIVTVNPLPICTITGGNSLCLGQSTQLCTPAGAGTYLWSTGATTNCITVNAAGTYSVTVTNASGCSSMCSQIVTVNPLPICTITGNTSICQGQSTQLCVAAGAGTYLWSTGATTNCITVNTVGTYAVTVTNSSGCSSVCSQIVLVNPLPICTITGNNFICAAGQSTQLCVLASAGTYLWSTGATTNCITVNAAGTYSVTVTNASGCSSICSQTVTINPLPICTITGNTSLCVAGQSTQLCVPAGAAAYLWSTGATTNCISVNAAGTYSVTVTNAGGCSSICSQNVTVNPLPTCAITGNTALCPGQSTQLCTPAGAGSYQWSTGATTNCITVNAAGTYSVTVTNAGGCSSVCSLSVTSSPSPICTITGSNVICAGESTLLCVPAGAASYLWNTGATTNCIVRSVAGTYSVTVTNAGGCSSVCSMTVAVVPLPVCVITGDNFICAAGQSTQLCVPAGASSYLWSTGAITNCITVNAAGTYTVTVTNIAGCSSICSQTVTVNPLPVCTISGNSFICETGQTTQLCVPAGASAYLWSTGATTNCITVGAAGTYSVTVTNTAGCSSICSRTVTVSPLPACTITGNNFLCVAGQTTQLCVPLGAAAYLWSTGATTNCITVGVIGTYSVTVTNASGCSSVCSQTVTGSPILNCAITGNCDIPCGGQPTLLCAPIGCATYWWSTGATTSCISVSVAGTYCVTVTNASGCSSVCCHTVTSSQAPSCEITGNCTIPCSGQPTLLCAPAGCATYWWNTGATTSCISVTAPGTYCVTVTNASGCSSVCSHTVTAGSVLNCEITGSCTIPCSGQPTLLCAPAGCATYWWNTGATTSCISVNTPGNYCVTVTNASGCSSVCSHLVTAEVAPICQITGNCSIPCSGQPTLLCGPAGCTSYWWTTGATTSCIIVNTPGTYCVTVTNAGGCTSSTSVIVTQASPPSCAISGNCTIFDGQPTLLCAPAGSASYWWSTGATTSCIIASVAGNYAVTVANASGCTSSCYVIVTQSQAPGCLIAGNSSICQGQSTQLCAPDSAAAYLWSTGATTRCITVSTAGNYAVTISNASGFSNTCNKTVVVSPTLVCAIAGNTSICAGQSTLLCASAGASAYLWSTGATTGCIIANTAGSYTVTATNLNGCSSTSSKTVTVNPLPACSITGNLHPIKGDNTVLCATADMSAYLWSTGDTTRCITVSDSATYAVTVTNANGCSSTCAAQLVYLVMSPPIGTDNYPFGNGNIEARIYPNPFNTNATIEFKNTISNSHVVIDLCRITGSKIATLTEMDVEQGKLYKTELRAEDLDAGVYICRIINGGQVINKKLVLVK